MSDTYITCAHRHSNRNHPWHTQGWGHYIYFQVLAQTPSDPCTLTAAIGRARASSARGPWCPLPSSARRVCELLLLECRTHARACISARLKIQKTQAARPAYFHTPTPLLLLSQLIYKPAMTTTCVGVGAVGQSGLSVF